VDPLALHASDGVIELPVAGLFAAVAVGVLAVCLARSRQALDDRLAPMAGLVAAFVFAVQMLNYAVLPGVSGHLVGGALAALLVGPWVGALCLTVVLVVQALMADGGLTALGINVTNMALVSTFVAYLVIVGLLRVLPRTTRGLAVTGFIASVVSVVIASLAFIGEYWIGGGVELAAGLGPVAGTMAGVHVLIGIGEGLITAVTVVTVARVRPDLVYALRGARLTNGTQAPAAAAGGAA
jgi:cobalt/nickel transport system permease protein